MGRGRLIALSGFLALGACGDDGGGDVPSADGGVDGGAVACGELPADLDGDRDPACPDGASWVAAIESGVQDLDGEPLPGAFYQTCIRLAPSGNLVCLRPTQACDDGRVALVVPEASRCMSSAKVRALRLGDGAGDGRTFATSYCPLDGAPTDGRLGAAPVSLYETQVGFREGPDPDWVAFQGGLEVRTDRPLGLGADLRARSVDGDDPRPCFLPEGFEPLGLWAFSPEPTRSPDFEGEPLDLRVPNRTDLAPGTEVDLYVLGSLTCQVDGELLEEGEWRRYGTATVDAEGRIAGATLPCLSWFGYAVRDGAA